MTEVGEEKGKNRREEKGTGEKHRWYQKTDYKAVYTLLQCCYLNVPGIILGQKSSIPELVEPHR